MRRFGAGVLQAALGGLPVAFLNLQVRKKKNSKVFLFFQKYFLKRFPEYDRPAALESPAPAPIKIASHFLIA